MLIKVFNYLSTIYNHRNLIDFNLNINIHIYIYKYLHLKAHFNKDKN